MCNAPSVECARLIRGGSPHKSQNTRNQAQLCATSANIMAKSLQCSHRRHSTSKKNANYTGDDPKQGTLEEHTISLINLIKNALTCYTLL